MNLITKAALVAVTGASVVAVSASAASASTTAAPVPASAAPCDTAAWGGFGTWGPVAHSKCGFIGAKPDSKKGYTWAVISGSAARACVQGWGYDGNGRGRWYSLGCGTSGGGAVHWGNVAGVPKVRVLSQNVVTGAPIWFR